ncbi:MAG: hypothetical protein FWG34_01830 [Oscillospiraceae bacterium]|nr:hypothetical protein [Oscillospiraceae bacterium]
MENRLFYASRCGATLNSDVYGGGGDDDTEILQSILDKAAVLGRVHLVLDGAARISKSLKIHSNTTIECPDKSCGLFLSGGSNSSLVRNANFASGESEIADRNITLRGGVYNHNSPGQLHHREEKSEHQFISNWVFAMELYGVEHVLLQDVTIANQRTFAMLMMNFKYVAMENIHIDRRERMDFQNQDGLHFWGPGRFLTLRNIYGNVGDDFIALAPDEHDLKSSIEDVLIDGIHLEEADQGIRMLSCGGGRLDRVVVKNVSGTYRSYGFIINPWGEMSSRGCYGNIVFDSVDLRPMKNNYDYSPPFLFKLGGNIESLALKNIHHHRPEHSHAFLIAGGDYMQDKPETPERPTKIGRLEIRGLCIDETKQSAVEDAYIRIKSKIESLSVEDVYFSRSKDLSGGTFIKIEDGASVEDLQIVNATLPSSLERTIDSKPNEIKRLKIGNMLQG